MLSEIFTAQINTINEFGDNFTLILFVSFIMIFFLFYKKFYISLLIFLFTYLSYPISIIIKNIFKLTRPYDIGYQLFFNADRYSFPSSHVLFYTVYWGFIYYISYKYRKLEKYTSHVVRAVSLFYIVGVGASRIFVGAHYLRDVVFGYVLGILYLIILILFDKKITKFVAKNNN